jgi:hypothetical protein
VGRECVHPDNLRRSRNDQRLPRQSPKNLTFALPGIALRANEQSPHQPGPVGKTLRAKRAKFPTTLCSFACKAGAMRAMA